jgi:hypothetical protein
MGIHSALSFYLLYKEMKKERKRKEGRKKGKQRVYIP